MSRVRGRAGVPLATALAMFAKGKIDRRGVFAPEGAIDPDAFFGRHSAILGQSGAGKSWTVTSFIQSTLKTMPNAHIIILDLHGEYGTKDWEYLLPE